MKKLKSFLQKKSSTLLILLVISINLFFGLPRIANFSAIDEHLWTYDRIPQFWNAIEQQKWKQTNINDKPGVTDAIISGIGLLFVDPLEYKSIRQEPKSEEQLAMMKKINTAMRLPIYLFTLAMAPIFFIFLKKLFNETIAAIAVAIIYLSPIILGISLFINPDSLLWIFSSLSIICFLLLQKTGKSSYAHASGAFLGLALLTKYVSTLLYAYFLLLIFLNYVLSKSEHDPAKYFKKAFSDYLRMFLISFATIFVLYPATWISLKVFLKRTLLSRPFEPIWEFFLAFLVLFFVDAFLLNGRIFKTILDPFKKYKKHIILFFFSSFLLAGAVVLLNTYGIIKTYDFELLLASPKGGDQDTFRIMRSAGGVFTGIFVLFFEMSPIIFLSLIFAVASSFKNDLFEKKSTLSIFFLLSFIMLYYLGSAINHIESTIRYQISVLPIAAVIAAIGIYRLANIKRLKGFFEQRMFLLYAMLAAALTVSLISIKPFYFSYASSFLPKDYVLNVKDMGDGSFEAARYLNSLPDAKNLTVWADKVAVCELFVGTCHVNLRPNVVNDEIDYFVVSRGRTEKSLSFSSERLSAERASHFREMYSSECECEYEIEIDERPGNFIRIIKNKMIENVDEK
ncbi:MAG TPA: glycosyltransferase family 39 protein [Candidatus Moranbacteria bacterium]|jgi:4-amino-4-deoxy-L-arabinose transferase-like glycosyltransferase|nr:glycosyltransferase family 39 protein [Candidatus Moranbacteria bacterium]HPX94621.1 glycosyltransferase family 39 protein [Candidatus Moranbacteria bacterium]